MSVDLSIATEGRIREALAIAAVLEERIRGRKPKGSEIVFRALSESFFVLSRLPDNRERRWLRGSGRSAWPHFALSDEEREAAYRQAQWLVIKGLESAESLIPKGQVSPRERAIMDDVFDVFRKLCVGKEVGRDWTLMWMMAGGLTAGEAGKRIKPRLTARSVKDRVDLQCTAIAARLRPLMEPVKTRKVA
jgi:hypothetical protein